MKPENVLAAAFLLLVAGAVAAALLGVDADKTGGLIVAAVVTGWLYFNGTSE